jgi:hypothetical protein
MLIATAALPGPKMLATTVGNTVKYDPFAIPFTIANIIRGVNVRDTGQIASMLTAFSIIVITKVFVGPILSQRGPPANRPIALQALNAATKAAPVLGDDPND